MSTQTNTRNPLGAALCKACGIDDLDRVTKVVVVCEPGFERVIITQTTWQPEGARFDFSDITFTPTATQHDPVC